MPAQTLTYATNATSLGARIDSSTGNFSWTPSYPNVKSHNILVEVSDGTLIDSETITVDVSPAPSTKRTIAHNIVGWGGAGVASLQIDQFNRVFVNVTDATYVTHPM